MAKRIYIVRGSAGEYDCYHEWDVCAYRTRAYAEALVLKAQAWADKHYSEHKHMVVGTNPYDAGMTYSVFDGMPYYGITVVTLRG